MKSVHVNGSLAQTVLNTEAREAVLIPGSENAKAVVLEDLILDSQVPDFVATSKTAVRGSFRIGNQQDIAGTGLEKKGTVLTVDEQVVCDATPLPVVWKSDSPIMREGPFPCVRDTDGKWYFTVVVNSLACTGLKSLYYRADFTVEF
jgi:hypothetical protein